MTLSLRRALSNSRTILTICVLIFWSAIAARAQQPPPAASAPLPPLPNRVNNALPSWLRVRGEFRERLEGFAGLGFVDDRDDAYGLSRFRFNATVTPKPLLSFQVQAQDARVAEKQVGPTGLPFHGTFDLRMAFADVGSTKSPVVVRAGRQELAFGEQRLVGHVSWLNTARTFDAVRVTVRHKTFQVDAFGASVVKILDKEFDKSGAGNRFFGAYTTTGRLIPNSSIEPYVFWRGDRSLKTELGATGDLQEMTVGVRWAGKLPVRLDYGTEMAVQDGSLGSDSIRAWAGHWQLRESLLGRFAVHVTGEYNYASGDKNPTDGTRGTFDHLYPTPHDKYGLANQVGWRNIKHVRLGGDLTPRTAWLLSSNYHSWWLAEAHDGLYNAVGSSLARVASGATSTYVGQEIDVQIAHPLTPQLQLAAGIAHIFPGSFLKQATPGASYTYPFVMVTYVFLADK